MVERRTGDDRRARGTRDQKGGARKTVPRRAVDAGDRPGNRNIAEQIDAGYCYLSLTPAQARVVLRAMGAARRQVQGWELADLDAAIEKLEPQT